jgi:hypothetical protein
MRISLAIVTRSEIHIETAMCLMLMLRETQHEFHINFRKGTYIHELRNDCVREARIANADYLMFIDSDMTFPPDGINKLIAHNKEVVGGMYNMKSLPPTNTIKMLDDNGNRATSFTIPLQLFKAHAIPTGFMLIQMEAIKSMKFPFEFDREPDGGLIGEDVLFCMRCQELGFDIWCDPTIRIGHIGDYLY